jgi:hypothetical protein
MGVVNQIMERGAVETRQPLVKMAQQASQDGALLAARIQRYGAKEGLTWSEIGRQLRLDSQQLARLALCRAPRRTYYDQDLAHIAAYVGLNPSNLRQFLQRLDQLSAAPKSQLIWKQFSNGMNGLFKRRAWSFSLAMLFLFILGAVAFAQPKPAQAATLVVLQGEATVIQDQILPVSAGDNQQVLAAGRGMTVNAGDEISLGANANAQLRLFDGSTVDLFENTSLQVTELQTSQDKYRVGLHMLAGKTVSRVIRLLGVGDAFKVSTPSSTASVRGTVFTVEVLGLDASYIACDKGIVWVEMDEQQVEVSAGFEVTATVGQPLGVQSQTEEEPVIVAAAPVDAPSVDAPSVDAPPVDAPPESPEKAVPDNTPEEEDMPLVVDIVPPDPPVKAKDKPHPPVMVSGDPTDGSDVGDIVSATDGTTETDKKGGRPTLVPGNTPTLMPDNSAGTPPDGGGTPPGQDNNDRNNNNAGGGDNSSENNSKPKKPKG